MPFDFNERPIRIYGLFPRAVIPVDVSVYGYCVFSCNYCTVVDTPITTYDLQSKPSGEVQVGDKLLGWTNTQPRDYLSETYHIPKSEWCEAVVTHVFRRTTEVVRITLSNGDVIRCTPDHHWYTGYSGVDAYKPTTRLHILGVLHKLNLQLFRAEQSDSATVNQVFITSIEPDGEAEVASFSTSTGNYVANGYLSRNCFANLNRQAHQKELHREETTSNLFRTIASAMADETDPVGFLLREKYPIRLSNTTDPFQPAERKYRSTEAVMKWAKADDVPLFVQTRGADVLLKDWSRYSELLIPGKDVIYLSYCQEDDAVRKRIEPGAPSLEKRRELICAAKSRGIPVIVACNPYLAEWVPSPERYCETMKDCGASAIFLDPLHFNATQTKELNEDAKKFSAKANLRDVYLKRQLERWYAAADEVGIEFSPAPHWSAILGFRNRHQECVHPEWMRNRLWDYQARLSLAVHDAIKTTPADATPVVTFQEVLRYLQSIGMPNPVLDTGQAWVFYNNQVKADWVAWRDALGHDARLYDILRYAWNHPAESQNFYWDDPHCYAIPEDEIDDYFCDERGDIVSVLKSASVPPDTINISHDDLKDPHFVSLK